MFAMLRATGEAITPVLKQDREADRVISLAIACTYLLAERDSNTKTPEEPRKLFRDRATRWRRDHIEYYLPVLAVLRLAGVGVGVGVLAATAFSKLVLSVESWLPSATTGAS